MNESELLTNWAIQKATCNFNQLQVPHEVECEFKGSYGHPSSYAYVRLAAEPSSTLEFTPEVSWPKEFDPEYAERIKNCVAEAVVDGLLVVPGEYPYRGCHVRLVGFRWHTVGGSEAAVRRATTSAVELLRQQAKWYLCGGRYRDYTTRDA